ncbi:MAG: acyl-CoA thioesterase [Cyclobacteriaceae bacterium]|nr:acyl-CoA thioesterase [Cyclobacteriaceae bacterium]
MIVVPEDRTVFRVSICVKPEHIDELNHVNNVVYLQWVQDVAYAHWDAAADEALKSKCQWVVLRHELDYHAPALVNDLLEAATWIDKPEGARQKRHVAIFRVSDGKRLTSAVTTWCLLDPTGRPRRVTDEITHALGLKDG